MKLKIIELFLFSSLIISVHLNGTQASDYPIANLSTTWINSDESSIISMSYDDNNATMRVILLRRNDYQSTYACGFYCDGKCDSFIFTVFLLISNSSGAIDPLASPRVIWIANRNDPVKLNAVLQLTSEGEMVLKDVDGTSVWSTSTSGKSVAGLNMTRCGNLVLFSTNKSVVWQSFDHPTDTLLLGQRFLFGQKLISRATKTGSTQGKYSMSMTHDGLFFFLETSPPQAYANISFPANSGSYVVFRNNSFDVYNHSRKMRTILSWNGYPQTYGRQYMRLMDDGRLYVFRWRGLKWDVAADIRGSESDILGTVVGACRHLSVCGRTTTMAVPGKMKNKYMVGIITCSILVLVAVVLGTFFIIRRRRNNGEAEQDYLDHIPGILSRLSYEELKVATENFTKKLGQGGFGSVFEGILEDGTRVAVKCLDGIGQVKNSFLAEVESIGSIHHVNLVRLVGFAAEKSERLLVYEYMSNGSLDRWIYHENPDVVLDWKCRRKIILDVAKGLQYLHEDCRQKIIHLDVKPQNILLDENFNAKLSDFGLSKLIDRDQTQVVTTMRGTPGYLAPEWLSAVITEKVDVYGFGVVVLEILCGRRVFERSKPEEERHLLDLFKQKVEEGQMIDLVDKQSEDMQYHGEVVVEMMQLAAWCLLSDYTKRPSMLVVVKVLEGGMETEKNIDFSFLNFQTYGHQIPQEFVGDATPLLASILSAPILSAPR